MGCHTGGNIADGNANPPRSVRRAGHRCQTAFALHQKIIGLGIAHRTVLTVSGDVAGHETREPLSQRGGIEPKLDQRARQQVLNKHIRVFQHPEQDFPVLAGFNIQGDRFFPSVQPCEIGAFTIGGGIVGAGEIACALAFDLDHARAGIGQSRGAKRRGDCLFQRNYEFARKGG